MLRNRHTVITALMLRAATLTDRKIAIDRYAEEHPVSKRMSPRFLPSVMILGAIATSAATPARASLVADGLTYTLYESTTANPKTDQFTLDITGINGPSDTEGSRYGVNSLAFNETSPMGSVVTGTMTGFTFMTGGLNAMGCDGTGNFFCFKAATAPTGPALAANSELTLTFDLTVANASDFTGYNPDLKIQWLGGKSGKYDLVSQTLTPTVVPLPATLPLLFGGIAGLGFMRRSKAGFPPTRRRL
jgi:hypothetical protein